VTAGGTLIEVFSPEASDAAAIGFALAHIGRGAKPVLWVQDRMSQSQTGRPYLAGIGSVLLIRVDVSRPADVLWAMEDGLRCKTLSAVIGEIWGDPPALSFTATKRLVLRAEASGVPVWLIRRAADVSLSAARERWRVASLPSAPHPDDLRALGSPRWRAELFRSRSAQPGQWVVCHDRATDHLDFSATIGDGALAEVGGTGRQRAAR
jgi:protein ImuA